MPDLDQIESNLWTASIAPETYGSDRYPAHVLEQYKLCVQMADNISARRATANTFFLTFNTAIVGALAALFEKVPPPAAFAFYAVAIVFCVAWGVLLRSYRTLNTAKFKVIGLLEKRLPASPLWAAEWKALGEGKDWRTHIPLTPIETFVPVGFAFVYVYLAAMTLRCAMA